MPTATEAKAKKPSRTLPQLAAEQASIAEDLLLHRDAAAPDTPQRHGLNHAADCADRAARALTTDLGIKPKA